MDLTFQVDSEDSPMAFDPDRIYALYGFELYNEVMGRLAILVDILRDRRPGANDFIFQAP